MSLSFERPMNPEAANLLRQMIEQGSLPQPIAQDDRQALFDDIPRISQKEMAKLANAAKQPVTVTLNSLDEIKEMSDGTKYRVTNKGWIKIID